MKEKENKNFQAYNAELMSPYFNLDFFFYPNTVFTCALKAEGIPAEREMTILLV